MRCGRDDGVVKSNRFCFDKEKPIVEQECNTHGCIVKLWTYSDDACLIRYYNIDTSTYGNTIVSCSGLSSKGKAQACGTINVNAEAPANLEPLYLFYQVINTDKSHCTASLRYSYGDYSNVYAKVVQSNRLPAGANSYYYIREGYITVWMIVRLDLK